VGATDSQIRTALGVARAVKKVATEKVETVAKVAGSTEVETEAPISTGCGGQETNADQAGNAVGGCGKQKNVATISDREAEATTEPCGCG
jgi:hypothetical protein